MPRLPIPGSDDGAWGDILNEYLSVGHNTDATHKTIPITQGGTGATTAAGARTNLGLTTPAAITAHIDDTASAHAASAISFNPTFEVSATNIQDALEEIAAELGVPPVPLSDDAPQNISGSGAAGSQNEVSRDDHVHSMTGLAVDADLTAHISDTTSVHGIADTSLLETTTGAQAKVDAHDIDTTSVHGIANTANLETPAGAQAKVDTHAADADGHHAQAHALAGSDHTVSGLTAGHVLKATGSTTFGFSQLGHSELSGLTTGDPHTQYLAKVGGTMTGDLTLFADPTAALQPATKQYVDSNFVPADHSTLTNVTANQHHAQAHVLAGSDHTVSGLSTGHVLKANSATTFGFSQLAHSALSGLTTGDPHTQYLAEAGGTMTGALTLAAGPTANLEAATKQYADATVVGGGGEIEVAIVEGDDYNRMTVLWLWTSPAKLANPATLPAGLAVSSAWSPDGEFLAVGHGTSPFLTIYQRSGTTFTKLANPATLPTGACYGAAWSPSGEFLAVGHETSPYITIYQRSGTTFTKLANPATLPTGSGHGVSWSPSGEFLAIGHQTSPYITIYQRSGTTFTKLTNPVLPTGSGFGTAWSPNGEFLAVGHVTTPFLTIYQRSGTTFTKLSDPATLPTGTGNAPAWSPNGEFLAVGHGTSPNLTIYQRSGTTFTKLTNPATLPPGTANGAAWSPNGEFLAIANETTSPFLTIYQRSGTTFTKLTDPATTPTGNGQDIAWSPDGQFLAEAHFTSPYITIYQTASTMAEEGVAVIYSPKKSGT